jgi:uncharacterized protein (TIGR03435 family)
LAKLICNAYGIDFDQLSGPDWLLTERYSVIAKVPPGTTKEDVKLMWQDLLSERFHLRSRMIKKDFEVYELSVAKGGPKLHKSGEGPAKQEAGFPVPDQGDRWGISLVPPRTNRLSFRDYSMAELANQLRWFFANKVGAEAAALGRVIDRTGLAGHYDFTLEFAGWRGPGGAFPPPLPDGQVDTAPFLFDALRGQLGLMLTEKKAPLDVLVIDHVDRIPTDN